MKNGFKIYAATAALLLAAATTHSISTKLSKPAPPVNLLSGQVIQDFNTRAITGLSGLVSDSLPKIDPDSRLERLWQLKELNSSITPQARELGQTLVNEYQNTTPTRMSLEDYVNNSQQVIERTTIDWQQVQKTKLAHHPNKLSAVQELAASVTARDMLSYQLTELFGSTNPQQSIAAADQVLQNRGREFYEAIPSLGDKIMSYGASQMTQPAVQEINRTQAKNFDIRTLRADDHPETAYRNAVNNIADLARVIDDQSLFKELASTHKGVLVEYLGVANYRPVTAREAMGKWQHNTSASLDQHLKDTKRVKAKTYAQKTREHYQALTETGL